MQYTKEQLEQKKQEIIEQLNLKTKLVNLSDKQVSQVTHMSKNTLAVWRSTGRYNLRYVKIGRRVFYPLNYIAEFLLRREVMHTGETIHK